MDVLDAVSKSSNATEPVLIIVVIAVALILAGIPLYRMMVKAQEKKRQQYMERDRMIVDVVKDNASAITKLSTVLETNSKNCTDCKKEQLVHFEKLHAANSKVLEGIIEVKTIVDERLERKSKDEKEFGTVPERTT